MLARENPFRVERIHALTFRFPARDSWDAFLARLGPRPCRGAIVGADGAGKSTLLAELGARLERAGERIERVVVDAALRRASRSPTDFAARRSAGSGAPLTLLIDGADHLPARVWRRFGALDPERVGLVITSHRAGLLPSARQRR